MRRTAGTDGTAIFLRCLSAVTVIVLTGLFGTVAGATTMAHLDAGFLAVNHGAVTDSIDITFEDRAAYHRAYVAEAPVEDVAELDYTEMETVEMTGAQTAAPQTVWDTAQGSQSELVLDRGTVDVSNLDNGRYVVFTWACDTGGASPDDCGWTTPQTFERGPASGGDAGGTSDYMEMRDTPVTVDIKAYINSSTDITRTEYESVLEEIEDFYRGQNINLELNLVEIERGTWYDKSDCTWDEADLSKRSRPVGYDVAACTGDSFGAGYYGVRRSTFAHSLEGENAIRGAIHEFGHYLGVQDTYGYPESFPENNFAPDVMNSHRQDNPIFTAFHTPIIRMNLERIATQGRYGIRYLITNPSQPSFRENRITFDTELKVNMPGEPGEKACYVYHLERYERSRASPWNGTAPYATESISFIDPTGPEGKRRPTAGFSIPITDDQNSRGLQLHCDFSPSETYGPANIGQWHTALEENTAIPGGETYWLPYPALLNECYMDNGFETPDTCYISCHDEGEWCDYAGYE